MRFEDTFTYAAAAVLVASMTLIAFFSMQGDSLTFDEMSHIPSGYSYLAKRDYRLNPEHPPLVKDIAALPLLFLDLNFPETSENWNTWTPDQQWRFGPEFLYRAGNNPDTIIFLARLPMLGFLLLLGVLIFKWAKKLGGNKAALIALTLFSFSPTFIAHGRLVTTDVAATFGFFLAWYWLFLYLENPSKKNLIVAGVVLGLGLLLKFTVILILPFFLFMWVLRLLWKEYRKKEGGLPGRIVGAAMGDTPRIFLIICVAYVVVGIMYGFHVSGYPPSLQRLHTEKTLEMYNTNPQSNPVYRTLVWMSDKPVLRAYEEYALGIVMNYKRSTFGNTTFFMGEISAAGWRHYFPVVWAIKEPIPLHLLSIGALGVWFSYFTLRFRKKSSLVSTSLPASSFAVLSFFFFIAMYWALSIRNNLNIGIRHILPTFPFVYLLIALALGAWLDQHLPQKKASLKETLRGPLITLLKYTLLSFLLFWYVAGTIKSYPYFISYFNEFAGGGENGHRYVVDSNLDWGQDFKRLRAYVEENRINPLFLDYFGGADATYYLGDTFIPWWSDLGPPKGYFAVSLTKLKGAHANPVKGFTLRPEEQYKWIYGKEPVAKIGRSIWVYYFE